IVVGCVVFFFQAEDGIRYRNVTGVQTCALPIYTALGWLGSKMAVHGNYTNGGEILSAAADVIFDKFGTLLLGIIVTLACFTTCVGLVVAAGQFFTKVTKFSYRTVIIIVTFTSFLIANQGLETIINY